MWRRSVSVQMNLMPEPHIYAPVAQDPPAEGVAGRSTLGGAGVGAGAGDSRCRRPNRQRAAGGSACEHWPRSAEEATSRPRFRAILVGAFAALALVLALVGIFGLIGYSVQQRLREFGVRVALGATRASVMALVLADARRVVAVGVVIGLASAAALARSMGSFLFGVQPLDAVTFVSVAVVLGLSAALASAIPALRAARVDPVEAFRNE